MFRSFRRRTAASARRTIASLLVLMLAAAFAAPRPALAQVTTTLSGIVRDAGGAPAAGAAVTVSGQNLTLKATTDARGAFAFPTLSVGHYTVTAEKGDLHAVQEVDLASGGANVALDLATPQTIGRTITSVGPPTATRSGTDVILNGAQLQNVPGGNTLPDILTQLPSAARGSNGQIHMNGDHNGLNYYIDGVQLPANLNRVLGNEVDPSDIGFLDAIEGAYPAQYGDRFATILNIGTKSFSGAPGFGYDLRGGSFATLDGTINLHAPLGTNGGSIAFSNRLEGTNRALDPATPDAPHNGGSISNQFLHLTLPTHGSDTVNFDAINSLQTFQIPPDTNNGVPANTDDNERQTDFFASLQYRHAIGDHGSLSFGPSMKYSRILDTNDLLNDLAPAAGSSCTDFSDCGFFSAFADRSSRDYRFNVDYDLQSAHHEIRAGVLYGATNVAKNYAITLQPNNALNPTGDTFVATDTSPNVAHQQEAYVQDTWRMGTAWRLDYGLRSDSFQIFSTDFSNGFAQVSPRVKLTRIFTSRASAYAYYGRLFVPFSFENVSPTTAAMLYTAANSPGTSFDLKPQRDSLYELGFHLPVGSSDVGLRISHKVSTDWIDDTQVGASNLHQDINFPQGRVDVQTAYIQHPLARNGRAYFSVTHSIAVNSANCETQLLQNCAAGGPAGGDFAQADHDQHWDANGGLLFNDLHGGWFSVQAEYGSGLSLGLPGVGPGTAYPAATDPCQVVDCVNYKVPPHVTVDVEKGVPLPNNTSLALIVRNLFNDRYAITLNNSLQGTHYAAPRTIFLELRGQH